MNESPRRPWVPAAMLVAVLYALVGISFARAATHVQAWRLAAWALSAMAYAAHIAYERFRLQSPVVAGALHVAGAVALGAFGVAVAANIHSLAVGSADHRQLLRVALGLWPLMTALPAFLVGLGANVALVRVLPVARAP